MRQKDKIWLSRSLKRGSSPHHVLPNACNVTASPRCRGLTAGWLFSCFRTTPNIDDMARGPTGRRRGKFPHCKNARAKMLFVCADELLWIFFFFPPHSGSGREHGEVLTTSSAVSQSRDATVTAAHVASVRVCQFFRQRVVSLTI